MGENGESVTDPEEINEPVISDEATAPSEPPAEVTEEESSEEVENQSETSAETPEDQLLHDKVLQETPSKSDEPPTPSSTEKKKKRRKMWTPAGRSLPDSYQGI